MRTLLAVLLLSGCSHVTEFTAPDGAKATLKSSIPARAKIGDCEIEQRSQSWWERFAEGIKPKAEIRP